jgi:hypothetical protein
MTFGGPGLTTQLTATGTFTHGNHPATTADITDSVTWSSSTPGGVSVSSTGLITSVAQCSNILISATAQGFTGKITGTMTASVTTGGGTGNTTADVTSIAITPGLAAVPTTNETIQFIAIGTTSAGTTVNLTNAATWTSSNVQVGTVGANTGLATAVSSGTTTITAIFANADGSSALGTASLTVQAGTSEAFTALTLIPNGQSVSASKGTAQFILLGTSGSSGLSQDVTNSPLVKWTSSAPAYATVSSYPTTPAGLVTGVGAGSTTVTATLTNADNTVLTAQASVSVTSTLAPEPLLSLTIVPSSLTVGDLEDTGQFLAFGTFSNAPYVRDLTNSVTWLSSFPNVFPVSSNSGISGGTSGGNAGASGGIVTAYGSGNTNIIAEYLLPVAQGGDGTIQYAQATFACPLVEPPAPAPSCYPGSQADSLLATLTVYNEGLNDTTWLVTAPSATGTPQVLHCGPGSGAGGSVCTATYPVPAINPATGTSPGTTVTLTATGGNFGGWSYNCVPVGAVTQGGPNSCTVVVGQTFAPRPGDCVTTTTGTAPNQTTTTTCLPNPYNTSNVTVGAIFN